MSKIFGTLIRELRKKQGITVRQLAIESGLSPTFISGMERGIKSFPGELKVKAIAEVLGQNSDELLALTGKVSSDVLDIILQKPIETCDLIRRLNHTSAAKRKTLAPMPIELAPELEFYPLELVSQENHTAVIGESGSGKSVLTQYLIQEFFQHAQVRAYDSDASPKDWTSFDVVGRKGNYQAIAEAMEWDLDELGFRTERHGDGQPSGDEIVRVIEEYPSTAAELADLNVKGMSSDIGSVWLRKLLRRGRKYRIKVFAVAQEFEVSAWKIAGEGGLRRAFTVLYLGATAHQALSQVKDTEYRKALRHYLNGEKYPCLVDVKGKFMPVQIPELKIR